MVYHVSDDEKELAHAIREGVKHRPEQSFGEYFKGRQRSCALGAAYEGIYRLPEDADGLRPKRLDRVFDCLDGVVRRCPEGCKKRLPLGALIIHLNDFHHWSREQIAAWVADPDATSNPDSH